MKSSGRGIRRGRWGAGLWVGSALIMMALASGGCDRRKTEGISMINRGVEALDQGDSETARSYFKRALRIDDRNPSTHYHLGLVEMHYQDNAEAAVPHFIKAEQLAPDDIDVLYQLGRHYIVSSKAEAGLTYLDKVLSLDPNHASSWFFKGQGLKELDDVEGADAAWRESIAIDPNQWRAFRALGALYEGYDAGEAARAVYEEGLVHNPNQPDLNNALAVLQLNSGEAEAALDRFQSVISRDSTRVDVLYNLAFAYAQVGKPNKGVRYLDAYIGATDPSDTENIRVAKAFRDALLREAKALRDAEEEEDADDAPPAP